MARTPKGWERLMPSRGQDGKPGRRLVTQDERLQVQVFRQKHGDHAGWRLIWEFLDSKDRWEFLIRDEHSNVIGQAFGLTIAETADALNEILVSKGYKPLPPL